MPRPTPARAAFVLALLSALPACTRGGGEPSLLLVTFDTTRADRLSCYGAGSPITPNVDALAARGVLFEDASTPVPLTAPAFASLLTGLWPFEHGVRNNGSHRLVESVPTLADTLRSAGFRTGAVVAAHVLEARFGLARGFESYDDRFTPAERDGAIGRRAEEVSRRGIAYLDELLPSERFFLWLHYYDPHALYDPPPPFHETYRDHPYEGEIAYADHALGDVLRKLESLGRTDSTVVVFTSDHGEGLGDHHEATHGVFLYQSTVHVPLVVAGPGVARGRREARPVSLVDVAPTVLALAGVSPPPRQRPSGVDLFSSGDPPGRDLYVETAYPRLNFGWAGLRAVRSEREKYVAAPTPELYDLSTDPLESKNLAQSRTERTQRLAQRLAAFGSVPFDQDPLGARIEVDAEARSRLEQLGYVSLPGAERPRAEPGAQRPDPKDMVALLDLLDQAAADGRQGRHDAAVNKLETFLEKSPENPTVLYFVGESLARLGQYAGAESRFGEALALEPGFIEARIKRGVCRQLRGELALAESDFRAAIESDPAFSNARYHAGLLLQERGDLDGAARELRKAVELSPRDATFWAALGDVLAERKDAEGARKAYLQAVESDPRRLDLLEKARELRPDSDGRRKEDG